MTAKSHIEELEMQIIFIVILLILSDFAFAQELHTFSNGEVADADKINENFNYVLEKASGGCSAKQEGSNVVITCPDGTSGVLAGTGSVYALPSSTEGSIPTIELPSGDVVVQDNDGVVLAKYYGGATDGQSYRVFLDSRDLVCLVNMEETSSVTLHTCPNRYFAYFLSDDCSGDPLMSYHDRRALLSINGAYIAYPLDVEYTVALSLSRKPSAWVTSNFNIYGEGTCETMESVIPAAPAVSYIPATEILEAAYPVSLYQFP